MSDTPQRPAVFVSSGQGHGGVLALTQELAVSVARLSDFPVISLGALTRPEVRDGPQNFDTETLALNPDNPAQHSQRFQAWIAQRNPFALLLNDCSEIFSAMPCVPPDCAVVGVLHDEGRRYRAPYTQHSQLIDGMITVADFLKEIIVRDAPDLATRTHAIHNGAQFPAIPARGDSPCFPIRLLYIGAMDFFRKGIQDLPLIAHALQRRGIPFQLSIAGGESEQLKARFARHELQHLVTWHGYLPREACFNLAAESDILLQPSRCEAFGLVAIEAMSMGCVPIAYDIESGLTEIIQHDQNGILVPLADTSAAAHTIAALAADPPRWRRLGKAASRTARERFTITRTAQRYTDLLDELRHSFSGNSNRPPSGSATRPEPQWSRSCVRTRCGHRLIAPLVRRLAVHFPTLVQPIWRRFA